MTLEHALYTYAYDRFGTPLKTLVDVIDRPKNKVHAVIRFRGGTNYIPPVNEEAGEVAITDHMRRVPAQSLETVGISRSVATADFSWLS